MFRLKELEILGSKAELAALPEGKLLINTINAHSYNTARKDKLFAEALTNGDVLIPDGVSIVKACKWIKAKSQPKERIAGWDLFSFEMGKLENSNFEFGVSNFELSANADEELSNSELSNVEDGLSNVDLTSEESSGDNDNQVEGKSKIDNSKSASADNSKLKIQKSKLRSPQRTVMFMGSSQKVLDLIVKRAAEVYPHLKVVTYSPPYKPEFSDDDNKAIIDAINAADPDLLWIGMRHRSRKNGPTRIGMS